MPIDNEHGSISDEFIEQLKATDERWKLVDQALKIEAELRDSEALKAVLHVVSARAAVALDKLVDVDPTDVKKIMSLQADVQRARIIGETIESIRQKGAFAADALQENDRMGMQMSEEGKSNDYRG